MNKRDFHGWINNWMHNDVWINEYMIMNIWGWMNRWIHDDESIDENMRKDE